MQKDFHYDKIYRQAVLIGLDTNTAYRIAYASQFVDDNVRTYTIGGYRNAISQTLDILKPQQDYEQIYQTFHYRPAGFQIPFKERKYRGVNPLSTHMGVVRFKSVTNIRDLKIKSRSRSWIGIFLHILADTYSHHGFSGINETWNAMPGLLAALTPNIGHADARHDPDITDKVWTDKRLAEGEQQVHNKLRQMMALHACRHWLLHWAGKRKACLTEVDCSIPPYKKADILRDKEWWKEFQNEVKWFLLENK